jgi:hypothetical protein
LCAADLVVLVIPALLATVLALLFRAAEMYAGTAVAAIFFAAMLLALVYVRFVAMPRWDARTAYAITGQRVLIVREGRRRRVTSVDVGGLSMQFMGVKNGAGHLQLLGKDKLARPRPGSEELPQWLAIFPEDSAADVLRLLARTQYAAQTTAVAAEATAEAPGEAPGAIRSQLVEGEALLWAGGPRQGVRVSTADTACGLFLLLLVALFEYGVITGAYPPYFHVAGVILLGLGAYAVFGCALVDAAARRGITYAVTNRRVLIAGCRASRETVVSLDVANVSLELRPSRGTTGTITFVGMGLATGPSSPGSGGRCSALTRFDGIEDAEAVFRLIHEAKSGRERRMDL